jgi:hypothetical protein
LNQLQKVLSYGNRVHDLEVAVKNIGLRLNAMELATTDSQQPQGEMPAEQQRCEHTIVCKIRGDRSKCPWPCGHYRPMQ